MGKEEDVITIDLGMGREKTIGWGCDLSEDYVKINAEYHT
jgi:glutamate N-acetyltransferase/amino-acid N-acetyltransferase